MSSNQTAGFGLYIHWPFCESKCPYCDFNSHERKFIDQPRWVKAYGLEIGARAKALSETTQTPPKVTSIFFGGGTPSLMTPNTVSNLIDFISGAFSLSNGLEITIEANPTSSEIEKFKDYRQAGVTRVSLGIQSLNNKSLVFLGRTHGRKAALSAIEAARETFPKYSLDIIYALPDQRLSDWELELSEIIQLSSNHLSLYQLTIEKGTKFFRDRIQPASDRIAAHMYKKTQEITAASGLPRYEISNHASAGNESRHNMTYWRGGSYLGVGPGAHSRLRVKQQWFNSYGIYAPEKWLQVVELRGYGVAKSIPMSTTERRDEVVMMGLRLKRGLKLKDFIDATGLTFSEALNNQRISTLVENGLVEFANDTLSVTEKGFIKLNSIISFLLTD